MLQTIPLLFAAGGFFLPVGQGASAGWRFVVWSNPLIELVLDVPRGHTCRSTASVRTWRARYRTEAVLLRCGDPLGGTSTSSSAMRGAAHRRYAICTRNVAVSYV